jgi:hypothetical protein
MSSSRRLSPLVILGICLLEISCAHFQASGAPNRLALMRLAREYGQNRQPTDVAPAMQPAESSTAASQPALETEEDYMRPVRASLNAWDFAQLEKEAQEARASKGRLLGGGWKVYMYYSAVGYPAAGNQATDADWANHLQTLNQWKTAQPDSATARIALAQAYVNYAAKARGSGYADSVTHDGWKKFNDRVGLASSALADAAAKKEKCPYWYEVMQQVALDQGWNKWQAKQLFDQATAFEPGYYHYYREYAKYLLPKWYGEKGEVQAFATETANRLGGQQGDFLYFEIASLVMCPCDPKNASADGMSWPRIRQGYAALGQLYGTSNLKLNRFAFLAHVAGDKPAEQELLAQIGDNWVESAWSTRENFDNAKIWAATP